MRESLNVPDKVYCTSKSEVWNSTDKKYKEEMLKNKSWSEFVYEISTTPSILLHHGFDEKGLNMTQTNNFKKLLENGGRVNIAIEKLAGGEQKVIIDTNMQGTDAQHSSVIFNDGNHHIELIFDKDYSLKRVYSEYESVSKGMVVGTNEEFREVDGLIKSELVVEEIKKENLDNIIFEPNKAMTLIEKNPTVPGCYLNNKEINPDLSN